MWLYRHNFHANGILSRYKARLVENGRSLLPIVDCDETFNMVVNSEKIQIVLRLVISCK